MVYSAFIGNISTKNVFRNLNSENLNMTYEKNVTYEIFKKEMIHILCKYVMNFKRVTNQV